MMRPSRGERRSATTMRHIGFLRDPTLVSLILTAICGGSGYRVPSHTLEELLRVGHLPPRHLRHQLAHLPELLDELVDRLHSRPGSPRDPLAPRAVDHVGPGALRWRHRQDDRLQTIELAIVHVDLTELLHRLA